MSSQHMKSPLWRPALAVLATVILLSACGSREDDGVDPGADDRVVPASALASTQAFTRYTAERPADDRADPVGVEGVSPPTSETAEPELVN